MDLPATKKIAATVHGWLTEKEGALLYDLAKRCTGRGVIVEIGSWQGKSTIFLGAGSQAGNKAPVYAVDPHAGLPGWGDLKTLPLFQKNIAEAELSSIIRPLIMPSAEAAEAFDIPIELLFIDGNHDFNMVDIDFNAWFPQLIDGGMIAFHDTCSSPEILSWPGPVAVVKKNVYRSKKCRNIDIVDTITVAQKAKTISAWDRCRNRIMLVRRLFQSLFFLFAHFLKFVRFH